MRLCRHQHNGHIEAALFTDDRVVPLHRLAAELSVKLPSGMSNDLLDYLPPDGKSRKEALRSLKRHISDAVWRQLQADLPR